MNEDGIEPALSPAAAGVPASPVIEPAAEAPPTIRPMPRARATVSGGLDLSLLASGELRRASLYIGLLTLLLVGPFVVTVLAFGAVQGGFDWIPEALSGLSPSIIAVPDSFWSFLSVSGIVAVLGLMVVTVESQIMAAAILGGRALGRPMTMREALRRSRQVFWRVVRASILVFLILLVPTVILNFWLQSVFGATSEAPTVIVTAVGAVIGAPFIYIVSGIVLGDVGASEAVRRSTVLARASWRTILGSNGADLLLGGTGDDFIDGQQGNDTAFLGAGNDTFQWDPGDGSDIVEGQDGTDRMLFNGSAGNEIFAASANGGRVLFTRNLGNIVMDLDGVEKVDLNTLAGTDTVTVNDLSGTDLVEMNVNLAGTIGGTVGDGAADVVIANATNGNDIIDVFGAGTSVSVLGLATQINITNAEGANDTLVINGLGGDDGITATTLPAGVIKLTLDGGAGNDTILGSQGADTILGGDGNDFVFGDNGNDLALLGAGDDVFQWDPGDGNDTLEGQDGFDRMMFFGSNASENINIVANGGRALFLRDVANVTMDLNDMEAIEFRALGGADNIVVGDLSGTDVTRIDLDLRGPNGGGDGAADTVTVNGTQGADVIGVTGDAGGITVFGLGTEVRIFFQEQANDRLILNGQGGDDVINASSLEADGIQLTMNGGLGNDVFIGSEGNDLINGGDGDDVALMGAGDDRFVWNPGDDNDTVEGQSGFDTLLFNGSNAAENITISANGGRVLFNRDIANVTMDLDDMEGIDFNALGGADTIVVNDMSGTDLTELNINLAGSNGLGDGQADTIIINATNGDDVVLVVGDGGVVSVLGLATQVNITGFEAELDRIIINGLAGDDVIEASGLSLELDRAHRRWRRRRRRPGRRRRQRHIAWRCRRRRSGRRSRTRHPQRWPGQQRPHSVSKAIAARVFSRAASLRRERTQVRSSRPSVRAKN